MYNGNIVIGIFAPLAAIMVVIRLKVASSRVFFSFIGIYTIRQISSGICLLNGKSASIQTHYTPRQIKLTKMANTLLKVPGAKPGQKIGVCLKRRICFNLPNGLDV